MNKVYSCINVGLILRSQYFQVTVKSIRPSSIIPLRKISRTSILSAETIPVPVVAAKEPLCEFLEQGKKYSWCSCGLSKKQPFCDGSHKKTGMRPVRLVAEETCEAYFCGCKQTSTPPYCDGTHMQDNVQNCKVGEVL